LSLKYRGTQRGVFASRGKPEQACNPDRIL
jgi:hypothetical protein